MSTAMQFFLMGNGTGFLIGVSFIATLLWMATRGERDRTPEEIEYRRRLNLLYREIGPPPVS